MNSCIPCVVPHCPRSTQGDFPEWICGPHWQAVSKRARRFKRLAEKRWRAAKAECEAIDREGYEFAKAHGGGVLQSIVDRFGVASDRRARKSAQADRAWERCKRQAIEAAGGIG